MKKHFALFFVLELFISTLFCEELNNFNTSWNCVLTGEPVCEPVKTSYGFCLINDAKMLQAFSDSGKLLWEKSIGRARNPKLFSLENNFFVILCNQDKTIKLINPTGTVIWENDLGFNCLQDILPGRDGRFFVKGKNQISCYGITGIQKWTLKTESLSNLKMTNLTDGSFIVFLEKSAGNQTQGIRISPFGEILESIIFSNIVKNAVSTNKGVLIQFMNGDVGLFSLNQDKTQCENKWLTKNNSSSSITNIFYKENKIYYLLQDKINLKLLELNIKDGTFVSQTNIENINLNNLKIGELTDKGIFLFDGNNCIHKSFDGKILYEAKLQKSNDFIWNYCFFSNQNYLIFCKNDWSINAYKIATKNQNTVNKKNPNYKEYYTNNYSEYLLFGLEKIDSDLISAKKENQLFKGNYGTKEIEYLRDLDFYTDQYINSVINKTKNSENTVFDLDADGLEKMLLQMSFYSSDAFNHKIAIIIKKASNKSEITAAVSGIKINGYDPNYELLDAIELLCTKISPSDEILIRKICDAVYSITLYMGRPAFVKKGKNIISNFLYPSYSESIRNYARETLLKITQMDL